MSIIGNGPVIVRAQKLFPAPGRPTVPSIEVAAVAGPRFFGGNVLTVSVLTEDGRPSEGVVRIVAGNMTSPAVVRLETNKIPQPDGQHVPDTAYAV